MKYNKTLYSFILSLFITVTVFGQDFSDSKKIEGYYTVQNKSTLKLITNFSQVDIEEWNKNQIQFTALIEAKTSSEADTKKLMETLGLQHSQDGNTVRIETGSFQNKSKSINLKGKSSFSYKIKIYVPKGTIYDASVKFGNLTTNTIEENSKVNVEFGNLNVNEVKANVHLVVKFGGLQVNKIKDPNVQLEFANEKSILKSINGISDITIRYSNAAVDLSNLNSGKIDVAFSKVYLITDKDLSSNMNLVSKFGKFNNSTSINFTKIEKDKFSQTEEYDFKNGSSSRINTKAEFSTITLTNKFPEESFYKSKEKRTALAVPDISYNFNFDEYFSTDEFKNMMAKVNESKEKALVASKKAIEESLRSLEKSKERLEGKNKKLKEAQVKALEENDKSIKN